jgi:hypothetical protein
MIKRLALASLVFSLICITNFVSSAAELVVSDDGARPQSRFMISDSDGLDGIDASPRRRNIRQAQGSGTRPLLAPQPARRSEAISIPSFDEPIFVPQPVPAPSWHDSESVSSSWHDSGSHVEVWDDSPTCGGDGSCDSGSCCGGCTQCWPDDCGGTSCGDGAGWFMDTALVQGFTWNPDDPASNFNTPLTFNDRANEYQLNQIYLSMGRRASRTARWDIGGQVDLLYGTDYFFTQAAGLETRVDGTRRWNRSGPRGTGAAIYGLAMPQMFAELQTPFFGGTNVKVGHFYTVLGYEVVPSANNFFYSRAYTMQYGEPFTHTGVLVSRTLGSGFDLQTGMTRGWDNWEDNNDNEGYLGKLSWTAPDGLSTLAFGLTTSKEDDAGINNTTVYSLVLTRVLSCRCRYVLQHDFGTEDGGEFDVDDNPETAKWYGINQYFFFDLSRKVTAGLRVEWFRDQDNSRVFDFPSERLVQGGNYTGVTGGVNWRAGSNMMVRSEVRGDWSDVVPIGAGGVFDDFSGKEQFTWATDIILNF